MLPVHIAAAANLVLVLVGAACAAMAPLALGATRGCDPVTGTAAARGDVDAVTVDAVAACAVGGVVVVVGAVCATGCI